MEGEVHTTYTQGGTGMREGDVTVGAVLNDLRECFTRQDLVVSFFDCVGGFGGFGDGKIRVLEVGKGGFQIAGRREAFDGAL